MNQQEMRYNLDQVRDTTNEVAQGIQSVIGQAQQQQERDFMLSRQTLGRPATNVMGNLTNLPPNDSLNGRAVQGGATIVTQFNRDNLDDDVGAGANDEIDDLRRE